MIEGQRPTAPLRITDHADAPLMSRPDSLVILYQVINTMLSGHFNESQEDVRQVLRQVCLTNLWFFLRFVAGYSGPFTKITPHLHAEVCNFYQESVESPGSKYAIFLGRSHYKTTIFTPGGNAWECLRDPNIQIATVSAVQDRAQEFLATTQEIFSKNEFMRWLFPEYYVDRIYAQNGWNKDSMTLPNKTRDFSKPNIRAIGALGSTQGIHVDLFKVDDPIGEDMLNADRQAGSTMRRIENWMFGAFRTLLIDPRESRILVAGTRYGEADAFNKIAKNARRVVGSTEEYEEDVDPKKGAWDVYWRPSRDASGEIFFPENISDRFLNELREDDPWSYYTQYLNKVKNAMTAEFREYDCPLYNLDKTNRGYTVTFSEGMHEADIEQQLGYMDIVMTIDPAASEKKQSARTSRSAVVVLAMDYRGRAFVIDLRAGYVPSTTVFDWIFEFYALYPGIRIIGLESQGPFKSWAPFLYEEARRRNVDLPVTSVSAVGDKDVRIRTHIQPFMFRRRLYVRESQYGLIMDEMRVFPDGKLKDILDALAQAISLAIIPGNYEFRDEQDIDTEEDFEEVRALGVDPYTGY